MTLSEFFLPGDRVVVNGDIEATVTGTAFNAGGRVIYHVMWWHDGKREEDTLEAFEVQPTAKE